MAHALVVGKVARGSRCRQSVLTACRLHTEGQTTHRSVFLTLTYRETADWQPGQIRSLVNLLREWCRRRGVKLRGVWVMELQKRGTPHYHIIIMLPKALSLPKPDKQGWWPHGSTKIETARNAVGYLAKYASKGINTAHQAPKGARICGAQGLTTDERDEKSWWMKPRWVRDVFGVADRPVKVLGGYMSRLTGEVLKSPWRLLEVGAKWAWMEFTDEPPPQASRPAVGYAGATV